MTEGAALPIVDSPPADMKDGTGGDKPSRPLVPHLTDSVPGVIPSFDELASPIDNPTGNPVVDDVGTPPIVVLSLGTPWPEKPLDGPGILDDDPVLAASSPHSLALIMAGAAGLFTLRGWQRRLAFGA